jgi:hypothetical protein
MDLPKFGLGRTTLTITDNTGTATGNGTYEALKSGVIVSLTVGEKVTPNAAIVLGRTFTLAEVDALWEEFEISDEETYKLITGQDPPTVRDMALYGSWIQSPGMPGLPGSPVPTYQVVALVQSDTFKVSNHLRAWFDIELRPRLASDGDTFPPGGPLFVDNGVLPIIQTDKVFVSAKGADGKREYRATGVLMRFYDLALQPLGPGFWEYRYVLRLAKK